MFLGAYQGKYNRAHRCGRLRKFFQGLSGLDQWIYRAIFKCLSEPYTWIFLEIFFEGLSGHMCGVLGQIFKSTRCLDF